MAFSFSRAVAVAGREGREFFGALLPQLVERHHRGEINAREAGVPEDCRIRTVLGVIIPWKYHPFVDPNIEKTPLERKVLEKSVLLGLFGCCNFRNCLRIPVETDLFLVSK